jgi:hypothetical protein
MTVTRHQKCGRTVKTGHFEEERICRKACSAGMNSRIPIQGNGSGRLLQGPQHLFDTPNPLLAEKHITAG